MADPTAFMAGVALMDKMLREADRQVEAEHTTGGANERFWIEACLREGAGLSFYLRPLVAELMSRPELVDGFVAALGDYIASERAGVGTGDEWTYAHLSYDDIMVYVPRPEEEPVSNVVPIRPPSAAGAVGTTAAAQRVNAAKDVSR